MDMTLMDRAATRIYPEPGNVKKYKEHRATRVVAAFASDATDCAELLAMLGLHAEMGK